MAAGDLSLNDWGTAGPWYYTGDTRGDNEREVAGENVVTVNGRRYLRVGPRNTSYLLPYAGAGDIIDDPTWGRLISLDLADRFGAATDTGFWNGPGPVMLAAAALGAFLAPAIGAGAVAEGGAVAAGEGGLSADLLGSIVTDTGSFASEFTPAAWGAPPSAFSLPSLSGASSLLGAAQSLLGGAGDAVSGALGVQGGGAWVWLLAAVVAGVLILR